MTEVADVPAPGVASGCLLIETATSLVSAGTERMLVEFGKANLIEKARQQPDRVRMVLDKIRTDGVMPTLETVRSKLDQPLALGYCNVGVVREVGVGVLGFEVGDRVASNGKHADLVCVPVNLCAHIPDAVDNEAAAFTVLGAIALQGIRLAKPTLGETVVVMGLGLIGLMAVQLLRANGCRVLGTDFDSAKLAMAREFGAETVDLASGQDPVAAAMAFSRGRGVDAVLVTASTKSNDPMHHAALMSRQRGRIVLIGVTGLELARDDFFRKELTFQVSSSYGPGRYDPNYEEKGIDYPFGFVRWTEQRNFEAVLDLLGAGGLNVERMISHRFAIDDAVRAYDLISGGEASLGVLLRYDMNRAPMPRTIPIASTPHRTASSGGVSFVGAGGFATAVLIPAFKAAGAVLRTVASNSGVSGLHAARKFGFAQSTTETDTIFQDSRTSAVVITTRHNSHARFVLAGLVAGQKIFVEKPLCLTTGELEQIEAAYRAGEAGDATPLLMVGFNRRFAPHTQKLVQLLAGVTGPKSFVMTVNAGAIPADHWTQDPAVGGGRILGEGCHFIDLLRFLAASPIERYSITRLAAASRDTASIQLTFADGSIGTIHYFANGSKQFPKERLEVFVAGRVLVLDNFRTLTGHGWPGFTRLKLWKQDKGHAACAAAFTAAVQRGTAPPIPPAELFEVARVTIALAGT